MLTGKQCTGRRKIIIQGIFGKLIRNPDTVRTQSWLFIFVFRRQYCSKKRKENYVGLEVKGKGLKGVCPLSCTDMNITLRVDRVWKNCSLGTSYGALQFKKLWPGHIYLCVCICMQMLKTGQLSSSTQLKRRIEIMPLLVALHIFY